MEWVSHDRRGGVYPGCAGCGGLAESGCRGLHGHPGLDVLDSRGQGGSYRRHIGLQGELKQQHAHSNQANVNISTSNRPKSGETLLSKL